MVGQVKCDVEGIVGSLARWHDKRGLDARRPATDHSEDVRMLLNIPRLDGTTDRTSAVRSIPAGDRTG